MCGPYETKCIIDRGYSVAYPAFGDEGSSVINGFYETLAGVAAKYFENLIKEDSRVVCRCTFSVDEEGETESFTVTVLMTMRRGGRRCAEKTLSHRWKKWRGRDTVMVR